MSDIPTDVITEFLSRIPVRCLLKLRCVCKSWKKIIDSKAFVKTHLKRSETNPKLILFGRWRWTQVSFDLLDTHIRINALSDLNTFSYGPTNDEILFMGNCHGLLLIACGIDCALWNPSTGMYTVLPYLEDKKPKSVDIANHYHAGFGYDESTDDYKVLRVLRVAGDDNSFPQTVVYSLKSHSYRRIQNYPVPTFPPRVSVFVFGKLHWILFLQTEYRYMILTFDLVNEGYGEVHMPYLGAEVPNLVCLGVFDGGLSLSCNFDFKRNDIWLLKDPKNRDSWAKLFSFKPDVNVNFSFNEYVRPISYSKCGKYVILEKDEIQLLCYDLELNSMRKIPLINGPPHLRIFVFSESLVGKKMYQAGEKKKTENGKKIYQAGEKKKTEKRDDFLSRGFKLKL